MNAPSRILLADDEPALLASLERDLMALWPSATIVARARNGPEALQAMQTLNPDVAFLDIRMPGLTGLQVAEQANSTAVIVFVTAFDQYAVEAFERAAVDYLLKPVSTERLSACIKRLSSRVSAHIDSGPGATMHLPKLGLEEESQQKLKALLAELIPTKRYLQWLRVGQPERVELVPVNDIVFVRADLKYTSVFTANREHLLRKPISELEEELDPENFWRVHRSLIINAHQVQEAVRDFRGRFLLKLKNRPEQVTVSNRYAHLFRQM